MHKTCGKIYCLYKVIYINFCIFEPALCSSLLCIPSIFRINFNLYIKISFGGCPSLYNVHHIYVCKCNKVKPKKKAFAENFTKNLWVLEKYIGNL